MHHTKIVALTTDLISGGKHIPYNEASCTMFDKLLPLFKKVSNAKSPHMHTPAPVDGEAMAQRVANLILPSLNEIIQKAVASALNGPSTTVSNLHTTRSPTNNRVELATTCNHPSAPPPLAPIQETRNIQQGEFYVLKHTEHPLLDTQCDHQPHLEENLPNPEDLSPLMGSDSPSSSPDWPHLNLPSTPASSNGDLTTEALNVVQRLTKSPNANWSCKEQEQGMQAVLSMKTDVMALMRTGSGKSMFSIVASILQPHFITVHVLPLKSLMRDFRRNLDDMGVPYEAFTSKSTKISGRCSLILVSADRYKTPAWRQALAEANLLLPVARVVWDEGQMAFTADDYRAALRDLAESRLLPVQMVVLSGSVPVVSQPTLMKMFGLGDNTFVVRTNTVRPELEYILEKSRSSNTQIAKRVLEIIKQHAPHLSPRDRALVFVPYIDQGEKLASHINCEFYHGGKELSDVERDKIYTHWVEGIHVTMICTSAFSAGNNYKHVRLVIHAGTPQEMIGCIQEKSRGGRDHQPAKCYFLPRDPGTPPEIPPGEIDHKGRLAMHKWLFPTTPICLRYGFTSFCDEAGTYCSDDPSYQKCSVCQASSSNMPQVTYCQNPSSSSSSKRTATSMMNNPFTEAYNKSKRQRVSRLTTANAFVDRMKAALLFFSNTCAYCKVHGQTTNKHAITTCPLLQGSHQGAISKYLSWKKLLSYNPNHHGPICYFCHVPQCHDTLHSTFGSADDCEHPDVVAPVAYAIYHSELLQLAAQEHFKLEWGNLSQFVTWLNSRPVDGEGSNLTALLLWYHAYQVNQ
jgi:hypothetical protein